MRGQAEIGRRPTGVPPVELRVNHLTAAQPSGGAHSEKSQPPALSHKVVTKEYDPEGNLVRKVTRVGGEVKVKTYS